MWLLHTTFRSDVSDIVTGVFRTYCYTGERTEINNWAFETTLHKPGRTIENDSRM